MNQNRSLESEIRDTSARLIKIVASIPFSKRSLKVIESTGGKISVADLIAYQIGWGKCLVRWYEAGIKGITPDMPGEGFLKWEYKAIANHFYQKYQYDGGEQQMRIFSALVEKILKIVQEETRANRCDQIGIWPWCTLRSGKQWPLSKWIRVNTVSPYKRAILLIKKAHHSEQVC